MPHVASHVAAPLIPPPQPGIAGFGQIIQQQAAAAGPAELQRLRDQFQGNTQALSFLNRGAAGPGGGIQTFSNILGQQAAAGGEQFNQNVAAGQFADNPLAQQVINQNLLASGQTFSGNQIRDFTPQEQSNVDFFTAAQTPGFQNLLAGIVETRATNQDPEFLKAVREGFFIDNPEAIAAANRGLRGQGLQIVNGQVVELTGVGGAEQVVEEALDTSQDIITEAVDTGRTDITDATTSALETLETGVEGFAPFLGAGQEASQQQAALSGALGPEAQAAAFAAFQESPEQQFLREEGRRQILASAAATGGLGSGEVQRELTRFGTGLASQDLQNRFNRLTQVTGQGIQSAAGQGTLLGQGANLQGRAGEALSSAALQGGFGRANLLTDAARFNAANRFTAGRDLATSIGGATTSLADLLGAQGAGISDITGTTGANIASILAALGQQTGGSQENLATILANLGIGEAGQVAGLPGVGGLFQSPNTLEALSRLFGAFGTLGGAFNNPGGTNTIPGSTPVTTINTGQDFAGFA